MSLINDALKKAKQAPPRNLPNSLPPLQPVADDSVLPAWLAPVLIIFLICAAIFFIGWSVAHHSAHNVAIAPEVTNTSEFAILPVVTNTPHPEPVVQNEPPDGPVLQGIFYSPTAPSAIVDGKSIHPGDKFKQYKVKEITKYTVTLIDKDGKALKLGISN